MLAKQNTGKDRTNWHHRTQYRLFALGYFCNYQILGWCDRIRKLLLTISCMHDCTKGLPIIIHMQCVFYKAVLHLLLRYGEQYDVSNRSLILGRTLAYLQYIYCKCIAILLLRKELIFFNNFLKFSRLQKIVNWFL